jgi:hypothetical protein
VRKADFELIAAKEQRPQLWDLLALGNRTRGDEAETRAPWMSGTEEPANVAAAVHDVQNQHHIIFCDAMNNEVVAYREAAQARAPILVGARPR